MAFDRMLSSYAVWINFNLFTHLVAYRSCTRTVHGGWKSMAKDTKSAIGLESLNLGCLAAILIGVAQSVRDSLQLSRRRGSPLS